MMTLTLDLKRVNRRPFVPQSWNRYSYALNDPLRFVDPTGTTCQNSQVDNGDGTFTDSVVDDGDGQGCAAAGVAAGQTADS